MSPIADGPKPWGQPQRGAIFIVMKARNSLSPGGAACSAGEQRNPLVQGRTNYEYLALTGLGALLGGLAINIAPRRGWDRGIGDEDLYKVEAFTPLQRAISISASPTFSAPPARTVWRNRRVHDCGETPQSAREARALPKRICKFSWLAMKRPEGRAPGQGTPHFGNH